jgi:hypothetical protein
MPNIILSPRAVARSSLWLVLIGGVSAVLFVASQYFGVRALEPLLAGIGAACSLFGVGMAAGASICGAGRRGVLIAAGSLFPLAFWAWVIYDKVYARYAG